MNTSFSLVARLKQKLEHKITISFHFHCSSRSHKKKAYAFQSFNKTDPDLTKLYGEDSHKQCIHIMDLSVWTVWKWRPMTLSLHSQQNHHPPVSLDLSMLIRPLRLQLHGCPAAPGSWIRECLVVVFPRKIDYQILSPNCCPVLGKETCCHVLPML